MGGGNSKYEWKLGDVEHLGYTDADGKRMSYTWVGSGTLADPRRKEWCESTPESRGKQLEAADRAYSYISAVIARYAAAVFVAPQSHKQQLRDESAKFVEAQRLLDHTNDEQVAYWTERAKATLEEEFNVE